MKTLVVVMQHATEEVDESRTNLMIQELNSTAQRFDYTIKMHGTPEAMAKILRNGVDPVAIWPVIPNGRAGNLS